MNVRPLFPTPVAYFLNFITSKERLEILNDVSKMRSMNILKNGGVGVVRYVICGPIFRMLVVD